MTVANILKGKRNGVLTVQPTQTIAALAERLRSAGVGVMIVSSDGKSLEGIISERDVAYGLAVHGAALPALKVSDLMTRAVITCSPGDTIAEVAKVMTLCRIRHLPVKDGAKLESCGTLPLRAAELRHKFSKVPNPLHRPRGSASLGVKTRHRVRKRALSRTGGLSREVLGRRVHAYATLSVAAHMRCLI